MPADYECYYYCHCLCGDVTVSNYCLGNFVLCTESVGKVAVVKTGKLDGWTGCRYIGRIAGCLDFVCNLNHVGWFGIRKQRIGSDFRESVVGFLI